MLVVILFGLGCELIVDFDRGRIDAGDSGAPNWEQGPDAGDAGSETYGDAGADEEEASQ